MHSVHPCGAPLPPSGPRDLARRAWLLRLVGAAAVLLLVCLLWAADPLAVVVQVAGWCVVAGVVALALTGGEP